MSQALNVLPEQLLGIAGMLTQSQSVAANSVTSASGTAIPVPADASSIGLEAAKQFSEYVPEYMRVAADGLVKLAEAAAALGPIAQGYVLADEESSAAVLQAAVGGLGTLTQTLTSALPQIAEAAPVTEAGLTADSEDRSDVSADSDTLV